jgi:mannose-6-phosphate isomerase-like protein (cupin superfamily)
MDARVIKYDESLERYTDERCHILESWNDTGDPDVAIARARVEPGVTTTRHVLEVDERYIITSGRGRVEVEGLDATDVTAGDVIVIPAGRAQQITNTGESDLVFYCVCTPRFEQRHYHDVEGKKP